MCGIFGIVSQECVAERLMTGLSRLEYRGYDSAGIALHDGFDVKRRRAAGKLEMLRRTMAADPITGTTGIAHTRWATHGAPSQVNAHPHHAHYVTVVHNGIIENHAELRGWLKEEGRCFESDTDTEVIVQLCDANLAIHQDPHEAVRVTLKEIEGAYALAFMFKEYPELIIAARQGSPLVIGHGEGPEEEVFETGVGHDMLLSSDALALAPFTRQVTYLEDGEIASLSLTGCRIEDRAGRPVIPRLHDIPPGSAEIDKGPHRHFMAKEIHEQPDSLAQGLRHLVDYDTERLKPMLEGLDFAGVDRVILLGCGTAHHACHIAKYWFEDFAGVPVETEIASEFRYRKPALSGRELVIAVSQSGETADTCAALRHLAGRVGSRLAIVNVAMSSLAREADHALEIHAGPEIGVASTKAFTGQLLTLAAVALHAGRARGRLDADAQTRRVRELATLPRLAAEVLALEPQIQAHAERLRHARTVLFLGRGVFYPLALEAALKLKEISYIQAEGYAAGELKHGPLALIDETVPVVIFAPVDSPKTLSNAEEVASRGGRILFITDAEEISVSGSPTWAQLKLPGVSAPWAPLIHAIAAQLLAYHVAALKGTDIDQPRNLAKSVTVE